MSKTRRKKTRVRKPNGFLYLLVYLLIYPVLKIFFQLKVDRSRYHPPDGSFIVLSNHLSFMDFLLTMLTVYPHRLNAVAAQRYFSYRILNWFLPLMGAIPKNLFDPDLRSIMAIMEVVKRGDRLLLYPEGRGTVHGPYMGIHKATGKLIKKLSVPVVSCNIEGSYTCMPFWRKGFRRGRVRVTLADFFSVQDTQTLTVEEINTLIDARLSGMDAVASQSAQSKADKPLGTFGKRRLAEGLESILYYCPGCQQEFVLKTRGNTICCTSCGNSATMSRSAELIPDEGSVTPRTVAEWYREQIVYETQFLSRDREAIRGEVLVRLPADKGRGLEECGQGEMWLDSTGWHFDGELYGKRAQRFFPIETVPAIPFDPNDDFQIHSDNFYVFTPKGNPNASAKYATLGECAYWYFVSNVQMTTGYDCGFYEATSSVQEC